MIYLIWLQVGPSLLGQAEGGGVGWEVSFMLSVSMERDASSILKVIVCYTELNMMTWSNYSPAKGQWNKLHSRVMWLQLRQGRYLYEKVLWLLDELVIGGRTLIHNHHVVGVPTMMDKVFLLLLATANAGPTQSPSPDNWTYEYKWCMLHEHPNRELSAQAQL